MVGEIKELSKYSIADEEKISLIEDVMEEMIKQSVSYCKSQLEHKFDENEYCDSDDDKIVYISNLECNKSIELPKYCPECGRKYSEDEHVCLKCFVRLKSTSDKIDICDIRSHSHFNFKGDREYSSFNELLCDDNIEIIDEFKFTMEDFTDILYNIKSQAFKNFNRLVKKNKIDFDSLDIVEKIILFTKSFVRVDYKSVGMELGYFEENTIFIDDRQMDSHQITTLIHELSHFIIHEILAEIICKILNATKNDFIETLVTFILSYTPFTELIDEYSAHNVEGRFTLFGYQDYSSYLQIESALNDEMSRDEIEITKSIGNSFARFIKGILESFIDRDLREEIKEQFLMDVRDRPNYEALKMENCQILNDEGFIKSLWLILSDGCKVAALNMEKLESLTT